MRAIEIWEGLTAVKLMDDTPPREGRKRPPMAMLPELAYATLIKPYRAAGSSLPAGAKGTVLTVFPKTHTYTIEFFEPRRTVETVPMEIVAELNAKIT